MLRTTGFVMALALLVAFAHSLQIPRNSNIKPKRLIQTSETEIKWMTQEEVENLSRECGAGHHGGFMDITDHAGMSANNIKVTFDPLPTSPTHQSQVQPLIAAIQPEQAKATNDLLTSFFNRYYTTQDGLKAAVAMKNRFESYIGSRTDVTVELFPHSWTQSSVIARIEGSDPDLKDQVVIISAHEDSISTGGRNGRAPGADDDASGCSTVMETFRVLVQSGYKGARSVEFHLYAAEEVGLLGSQDVAEQYQSEGRNVYAQMQLDMTFYTRTPGYIGIITDYVDAKLTAFLRLLIPAYTELAIKESKCGYGCSDHASWTKAGYRACFPFESAFNEDNPYIHSTSDTWDKLDLEHGVQFIRLALGFVVELSS